MIIVTPDLSMAYYRWLADKYEITFSEAIDMDDKNHSKDWSEFIQSCPMQEQFDWN